MAKRTHYALASLAAAATLLFGGIASGAFYSSSFDPPGPLNFSGTGLFQLDDSCLLSDGFYTASECHLTLLGATVDMTDTGTTDTGHLDFGLLLPDSGDMIDLFINGGDLVGVDSGLIGWTFASPCTGTLCGNPWWIQWQSGISDPVFLYTGTCNSFDRLSASTDAVGPACSPFDNSAGEATNVTFTRVPEPGTLALLVSALGAGWLARRRKTH